MQGFLAIDAYASTNGARPRKPVMYSSSYREEAYRLLKNPHRLITESYQAIIRYNKRHVG